MKYAIGYYIINEGVSSGFNLTSLTSEEELSVDNLDKYEKMLAEKLKVDKVVILSYYKRSN